MATDEQGRTLSDDGHYYWDGSDWQLVQQSAESGGHDTWPPEGYPKDVTQWTKEQVDYWFGELRDESEEGWSAEPSPVEVAEIGHHGDTMEA